MVAAFLVTAGLSSAAGGTWSAFTATTSATDASAAAGTVDISDSQNGVAAFDITGLRPWDPAEQRCVTVRNTGSLPVTVLVRGANVTGTGLGSYIDIVIRRGSFSTPPGGTSCTGFASSATLYSGTLAAAVAPYGSGVPGGTIAAGGSAVFQIEGRLRNDAAAQGKTVTHDLVWDASS